MADTITIPVPEEVSAEEIAQEVKEELQAAEEKEELDKDGEKLAVALEKLDRIWDKLDEIEGATREGTQEVINKVDEVAEELAEEETPEEEPAAIVEEPAPEIQTGTTIEGEVKTEEETEDIPKNKLILYTVLLGLSVITVLTTFFISSRERQNEEEEKRETFKDVWGY